MSLFAAHLIGFLLGLLVGSFLNVLIVRVPAGESIVSPGSHCRGCQAPVRWFDNIPVLSWLVLGRRCRTCKASIPWRYPAVELAGGLAFLVAAGRLWRALLMPANAAGFEQPFAILAALGFACLAALLICLIVIDWRTLRLPDAFTWTGIVLGLSLACLQAVFLGPHDYQITFASKHLRLSSPGSFAARGNVFLTGPEALVFGRLAAVAGAALLLLAVRRGYRAWRGRDGMGLGDVKMLAMIAAFLGFWPAILALFVGVLTASAYGTALMLRGRAHALTRLPFGSFMGVGGLVAGLWGERVLGWYRGLLG